MLATSIDGVEHSGILKGVMAGARIDMQIPEEMSHDNRIRSAPEWHSDRARERVPVGPARRHHRVLDKRHHVARHVLRRRHAPWCERPHFSRVGPPCAANTGVVHTTASSPSSTPWRVHGRQTAPPDRRRCIRQVFERMDDEGRSRYRESTPLARKYERSSEQFRTTYTAARLSPSLKLFSTPDEDPMSGVSCKYW